MTKSFLPISFKRTSVHLYIKTGSFFTYSKTQGILKLPFLLTLKSIYYSYHSFNNINQSELKIVSFFFSTQVLSRPNDQNLLDHRAEQKSTFSSSVVLMTSPPTSRTVYHTSGYPLSLFSYSNPLLYFFNHTKRRDHAHFRIQEGFYTSCVV